jgi:hypothetical protein
MKVKMLGINLVKPSVYLSPMAQQISKRPAIIRMIQEVVTDIEAPLWPVYALPWYGSSSSGAEYAIRSMFTIIALSLCVSVEITVC